MTVGGAETPGDSSHLVGRHELVQNAVALLSDPDVDGVVFHGDPGVGTSAVAEATITRLCDRAPGHALRLAPGAVAADNKFATIELTVGDAIRDMSTAVERFAACLSDRAVSAILIERAERVDAASAEVLVEVARARSVPVVGVHHSGTELAPAVLESVAAARYRRVTVDALDPSDTARVAADLIGGELAPRTRRWLNSLALGRPRVIKLLVDAALDQRAVRSTDAGMTLPTAVVSAEPVRAWRETQISMLSTDDRRLLDVIAVLDPTTPPELEAVLDDMSVLDHLDNLRTHGVVSVTTDERRIEARLADPLILATLAAEVSPVDRRQVRSAALAELGPDRERRRQSDRLRIARWSLDGDVTARIAELDQAARSALRTGGLDEARRYAELAHDAEQSPTSALRLARTLLAVGEWQALHTHTSDWLGRIDDDTDRAALASVAASGRFWLGGDERALSDLDDIAAALPATAAVPVVATRAALAVSAGRVGEGVELAESLLADAGHASHLDPQAMLALRVGYAYQGRPIAALRLLDSVAAEGGQRPTRLAEWRLPVLAMAGEVEATRRVFDEAMVDASESGSPGRVALVLYTLGSTHLDYGRVADATPLLAEATRWARLAGQAGMRRWIALALAYAAALVGNLDEADEHLAEAAAFGDHPARLNDSFLWRARAWVAHQRGDTETGRTLLLEGAGQARTDGNVLEQLECLVDLARLGWIDDALVAIEGIEVDSVDGHFLPAQVSFVRAIGGGDVESELQALDQLVEAGAYYLAVDLAVLAARRASDSGEHETASTLMRRADSLRATDQVADPFGMPRVAVAQLSDRELEVALLAVQGKSSREISDALFISTRTVDTHLGRIYKKLDVHSRAELAARVRHG